MHDFPYFRSSLFYFAVIATVIVFTILIYALVTFKKTDSVNEGGKQPNLKTELLWMLVPFLMLFLISLPVIKHFI